MEVEDLKKKIEKHEVAISEIQKELAINTVSTEKNTEVMEKLADTMNSIQMTMVKMNNNMEHSNESAKEMKGDIKELSIKISEIEENSKIDIMKLISQNWWKVIFFLLTVSLAYPKIAEAFIKTFK